MTTMQKLPWTALGLLAAGAVTTLAFTGCGSETDPPADSSDAGDATPPDSGEITDAFIDAITDGGRADAADCKLVAQTCTQSTDCCSANCNTTTKQCEAPLNACSAPGAACAVGPDCCTFSCIGGTCSAKQCVADKQACGADNECCGAKCAPDGVGGGTCTPLNPGGPATSGNPCVVSADCASTFCNGGVCTNPSFCVQEGDICAANADCCGGACSIAAGAMVGVCGAPVSAPGVSGCSPAGTICGAPLSGDAGGPSCTSACCTRACGPSGATNIPVCQPASGCHPTGEVCRADSDCCGWSGSAAAGVQVNGPVSCSKSSPTQEFGRCDNGGACREPGSICKPAEYQCSAENNCCEHPDFASSYCNNNPENCCRRDALGIPRCLVKPGDCAAPVPVDTVCATSADCCGKPCVNNKCTEACVPSAGECTTTADCCAGLPCTTPAGASKGYCGGALLPDGGVTPDGGTVLDGGTSADGGPCALFGQACSAAGDCCSGVPCTNGSCRYP
jgi:hypothetical protein